MSTLKHIAIILDGNRTWARENSLPQMLGHTEGARNIKRIVLAAIEQEITHLTLYTLSTENIKNRSEKELNHLFTLFSKLGDYKSLFKENKVRFHAIGDIQNLPEKVQDTLNELIELTKENKGLKLTFAINYGGRDEIIRAIKELKNPQEVTEEIFAQALDTADFPEVDLLIRTGGYQRLSNFLPWQSTYAELYFIETRWPAFSPEDLSEAIEWFQDQKRKKGA